MANSNRKFYQSAFKVLSLLVALLALTASVLFSQSNAKNKKETKKEDLIIYPSSKSMTPPLLKEESSEPKETKTIPEQTQTDTTNDKKQVTQEPSSKTKEAKPTKKKKYPVMPSSKAPDPGFLE